MTEPLTHCFHCNDAFHKVERNGASVPRNVPPFQMERDGQHVRCKSLIQLYKVWNVPCSTDGTGAIRSTPHSPLGSVWKLLGQTKFVMKPPFCASWLSRRSPYNWHARSCCLYALFVCAADVQSFGKSRLLNPDCRVLYCLHFSKESRLAVTIATKDN